MKSPNQMTGLEIMQAFQQGLVPAPGIAKTMGMDGVGEVEFGRIVFIATADERHTNPLGVCMVVLLRQYSILSQDARAIPYWQRVKDTARLI